MAKIPSQQILNENDDFDHGETVDSRKPSQPISATYNNFKDTSSETEDSSSGTGTAVAFVDFIARSSIQDTLKRFGIVDNPASFEWDTKNTVANERGEAYPSHPLLSKDNNQFNGIADKINQSPRENSIAKQPEQRPAPALAPKPTATKPRRPY